MKKIARAMAKEKTTPMEASILSEPFLDTDVISNTMPTAQARAVNIGLMPSKKARATPAKAP
jgi:hypothetical protein